MTESQTPEIKKTTGPVFIVCINAGQRSLETKLSLCTLLAYSTLQPYTSAPTAQACSSPPLPAS